MPDFLSDFFYEFVTLLVVLDPVGVIPLFLVAVGGLDRRRSILVAFNAVLISFLILLFFIVGGQPLLAALKIQMPSFQLPRAAAVRAANGAGQNERANGEHSARDDAAGPRRLSPRHPEYRRPRRHPLSAADGG